MVTFSIGLSAAEDCRIATGSADRNCGSGNKRSGCMSDAVEELVLSRDVNKAGSFKAKAKNLKAKAKAKARSLKAKTKAKARDQG